MLEYSYLTNSTNNNSQLYFKTTTTIRIYNNKLEIVAQYYQEVKYQELELELELKSDNKPNDPIEKSRIEKITIFIITFGVTVKKLHYIYIALQQIRLYTLSVLN